MKKSQAAFTIIELVLVILLLGVLSISVVPKMMSNSDIEHYVVRDRLVAQLRLAQLMSMQQRNICTRVIVTTTYTGIEQNTDVNGSCANAVPVEQRNALNGVKIALASGATPTPFYIVFNSQGLNVTTHSGQCTDCKLDVIGDETVSIMIESQGYIHAL